MRLLRLPSILAVSAALCVSAGCSKKGDQSKGAQATAQPQGTSSPSSTTAQPQGTSSPSSTTAQAPPPEQATQGGKHHKKHHAQSVEDENCPMKVPGAQARAQDVPEGVALIISTPDSTQVADLQQRSRRMLNQQAASTQRVQHEPPIEEAQREDLGDSPLEEQLGSDESGRGGGGLAGAPTMPSSAHIQDTPEGVVIVYTAQDPKHQEQLNKEVHHTADEMKPGICPGVNTTLP
ncbi:hypothetical protein LY474_06905 [Myxococcus stipitatus]|uniref:hypothetical protein n=1 Tax=Myxococcus stipitatus TaxID=83455 RepID=UPI001F3EBFE7|nr:hypothetical protein [Myxococcus stipitatus]MCE9667541.1 hypothetical protein [Myxococcus stipitatus]